MSYWRPYLAPRMVDSESPDELPGDGAMVWKDKMMVDHVCSHLTSTMEGNGLRLLPLASQVDNTLRTSIWTTMCIYSVHVKVCAREDVTPAILLGVT